MQILGIDIGGSGIKGAIVDTTQGILQTERHRIDTPQPATPESVAAVVRELKVHFDWQGPIGVGFPAVVLQGVAKTASNIDKSWIGTHAEDLFQHATGCPVKVLNDADAAGLAEATFGAGKDRQGVVMVITVGTGIGSALIADGQLVPNTELGHLRFKGGIAEKYAADSVRKAEGLSWEVWGNRFDEFLHHLNRLFSPDFIILGGGISKKFDRYQHLLSLEVPIAPATLLNEAGIVGAAIAASSLK